jgi:thiol-disulfide isomerase/thioredoxin
MPKDKQYKKYSDLGSKQLQAESVQRKPPSKATFDDSTMTLKPPTSQQPSRFPVMNMNTQPQQQQHQPQQQPRFPLMNMNTQPQQQQSQPQQSEQTESSIVNIKSLDQKNNLIESNRIVVVKIFGDFCQPCKMIEPAYEKLSERYSRNSICVFTKEDIKDQLTSDIRGVPTFHLYKDGVQVSSVIGADLTSNDGVEAKLLNIIQTL